MQIETLELHLEQPTLSDKIFSEKKLMLKIKVELEDALDSLPPNIQRTAWIAIPDCNVSVMAEQIPREIFQKVEG